MKHSQIAIFSLFWIFKYNFIVYAYVIYATTASTVTDDVTRSIFNTNLQYYFYAFRTKM